ncbi:MAG: hypothetical protein RMK31_08295, partial [Candidatus Caldarchaeum sp.]|nr:hypothetical protein [Candidatus Caldarchaeum sp.]
MFSSKRLEKIVDDIFALSPAVRYAEFFDGRCRRLAGGMRPGVKSLEPAKTAAKIDVETAKYATLLQKQKKYYGNFSHMFVETEKVNVLVVPYRTGVLVLTTNPPTGLELLPEVKKRLSAYSRPS